MTRKYILMTILIIDILNCEIVTACSCRGKRNVQNEFNSSEVVFIGSLIPEERFTNKGLPFGYKVNDSIQIFKFKVEKSYKETKVADTITIITDNSNCGSSFWPTNKYIVYGKANLQTKNFIENGIVYWTDRCMRTCDWSEKEVMELEQVAKK